MYLPTDVSVASMYRYFVPEKGSDRCSYETYRKAVRDQNIAFTSLHSVAECQFSTNLIITFDRNKIQTSNWYHFVSLVKAIRMTYNKALTDQVMTLIRGIFKFTTSLYDLK